MIRCTAKDFQEPYAPRAWGEGETKEESATQCRLALKEKNAQKQNVTPQQYRYEFDAA